MEEGNVRYRFCANVWCRVIEGQIMGQFIVERRLIRALCVGVAEGGGMREAEIHRFVMLDSCDSGSTGWNVLLYFQRDGVSAVSVGMQRSIRVIT
jgi:hypothetical protein